MVAPSVTGVDRQTSSAGGALGGAKEIDTHVVNNGSSMQWEASGKVPDTSLRLKGVAL